MGNSDHGTTYMREGGDDGELRLWHYIYVCSIDSRLTKGNPKGGGLRFEKLAVKREEALPPLEL